MIDLDAQQTRQLIDCEQVYGSYRTARRTLDMRYVGSMSWKRVRGNDYLYRKRGGVWRSLGPRNPHTERAFEAFHCGRDDLKRHRDALDARLRAMAPVNRALRLGRVPSAAAMVLRAVERAGLMGRGLMIAGTHALYAYERMGGVHFGADAVATNDIDFLYDARSSLRLLTDGAREAGLIGILKARDPSFRATGPSSFRAVNDAGFMVDLITPTTVAPTRPRQAVRIGGGHDELVAVEIAGLIWLENVAAIEQIVIDERGFPLTMIVPDPRAFASHKAWLAERADRDPLKRRRDGAQARMLATMLSTRLPHLRFDDGVLRAVPAEVMAMGARLAAAAPGSDEAWDG